MSDTAFPELTPRQNEVLNLLVQGMSNKEMSQRIGIGIRTIESHRVEIYRRLQVRNVIGAVRMFYERITQNERRI